MTILRSTRDLTLAEKLNFIVTNRIPRQVATRFMGWFSRIENRHLTRLSIAFWQLFVDDLRLFESRQSRFSSLHACFVRELKPGARPIDPDAGVLTSPCDAIVGEFGDAQDGQVIQAKGFPYSLAELIGDSQLADSYRNGQFVTLRLKSSMYHHFHAPIAGHARAVQYISGDTWNVNPIALKTVERLFCRNERAVVEIETAEERLLLVPVAAILVASMRLKGIDVALNLRYQGPNRIPWDRSFEKGEEMGYFEHGSTIVLLTSRRFRFVESLATGSTIRMGERLMTCSDALPVSSE